jgi:tRNA A-37 threonylcarbamoyl transferase component Bud32
MDVASTGAADGPVRCERTRFLLTLLDDEEHGRLQPVEHYEQGFPGLVEFVRAEYAALLRPLPEPDAGPTVGSTVGRYRIVRELAEGGMGAVLEAMDPELGRRVVLKSLHPALARDGKAIERLRREARILGSLDHANLVNVIDVVEVEHRLHLVMPFYEGRTLAAHIAAARAEAGRVGGAAFVRLGDATDRGVALRLLLTWFRGVAEALQRAHEAGIVHRDIKPDNLLVRPDASPVVLDFGLALPEDDLRLTSVGEVLGTPLYMAPEQIEGQVATPATDVRALGLVLYEALTLVHPFVGPGGRAGAFQRILTGDPVPPRRHHARLSRDLEAVVMRALEHEPARRYPTAAALAQDLARVLDLEPTDARPVSGMTAVWRRVRRRPLSAALVALLLVLALLAAWGWASWRRLDDRIARAGRALDHYRSDPSPESLDAVGDSLRSLPVDPGAGIHLVFPRGRVFAVGPFAWIGYDPVDEALMPGHRFRHRYALEVVDGTGAVVWQHEYEQGETTRRCELGWPADLVLTGGSEWRVRWIGARDDAGVFASGADEADGVAVGASFHVEEDEQVAARLRQAAPGDPLGHLEILQQGGYPADVLRRALFGSADSVVPERDLLRIAAQAADALGDSSLALALQRRSAALEGR